MKSHLETAEQLAAIGEEFDLAELSYEDEDLELEMHFEAPIPEATMASFPQFPMAAALGLPGNGGPATAAPAPGSGSAEAPKGEVISSPLSGVFYRAPRPDAPPFVEEGGSVAPGQTLCIIEAMKLMNELTAERPCQIVEVLVQNAEPVDEGQPLFVIA